MNAMIVTTELNPTKKLYFRTLILALHTQFYYIQKLKSHQFVAFIEITHIKQMVKIIYGTISRLEIGQGFKKRRMGHKTSVCF